MLVLLEGIVIAKDKIGELDLLVEFLTPKGKIRTIAKGAQKSKKRFLNLLEELNVLKLHLRKTKKGSFPILEKVDLLFIPESIWYDLSKYYFFSYLAEVISKISFEGLYVDYFTFVKDFIRFLDSVGQVSYLHKMFFELKMMKFLGWEPQLEICVKCGYKPKRLFYFSIKDGGVKCYKCKEEDFLLNYEQIHFLRTMSKNSFNQKFFEEIKKNINISEWDLEYLSKIVEDFFRYFLIFDLNSLKFLKNLKKF